MLLEQTPSVIELDHPSIRYIPNRGFVDAREDAYQLMTDAALGEICPECSYPRDGQCTWCPDDPEAGKEIPECHRCVGHQRPPPPWYRRSEIVMPALLSAGVMVLGTVASTLVLERLKRRRK